MNQFELRPCTVCGLLDGDYRLKKVSYCSVCDVWLCEKDVFDVVRRAVAAYKRHTGRLKKSWDKLKNMKFMGYGDEWSVVDDAGGGVQFIEQVVASGGPIVFDAVSNATPITTGSTISWTHAGTCVSNCVVFVCVAGDTGFTGSINVTATFNGVSMVLLDAAEDGATVLGHNAFILATGNIVGSHTVLVTSLGSVGTAVAAVATSWGGVNQATPNRTKTIATGPGSASPVTVTAANSQNGDVVVDCANVYGNGSTVASGTTPRYVVDNVSSTVVTIGHSSAAAAGANQVMNYPGTPDSFWNIVAIPLIP